MYHMWIKPVEKARHLLATTKKIFGDLKIQKKKIAAPEFRVWSPTTLLSQALNSLTTVDRTGNGAFC